MCSKEKTKELGLSALFDCDCWSKEFEGLAVEHLVNVERKHFERKTENEGVNHHETK